MFSPRNKGGFVTSWTLEIGLTTCLLYMSTSYPGQRISISVTIDSGSLLHYSRVVVIVVLFTLHLTHHTSHITESHQRTHRAWCDTEQLWRGRVMMVSSNDFTHNSQTQIFNKSLLASPAHSPLNILTRVCKHSGGGDWFLFEPCQTFELFTNS